MLPFFFRLFPFPFCSYERTDLDWFLPLYNFQFPLNSTLHFRDYDQIWHKSDDKKCKN